LSPTRDDSQVASELSDIRRSEQWVKLSASAALVALLGYWTYEHLFRKQAWIFIDGVNLMIHEGSHAMMRWAPQSLYILAGSAGQMLMPLAFAAYFFFKRRDGIATCAMLWWAGESSLGVARYMADAVDMALPTVGGEIHDWNFLMRRWHALSHAVALAKTVRFVGVSTMLCSMTAIVWLALRTKRCPEHDVEFDS
jgi:hypothetical protein